MTIITTNSTVSFSRDSHLVKISIALLIHQSLHITWVMNTLRKHAKIGREGEDEDEILTVQ